MRTFILFGLALAALGKGHSAMKKHANDYKAKFRNSP